MNYKVFVINPGSTTTKIGVFYGDNCFFSKTVTHDVEVLSRVSNLSDQLPYRRDVIQSVLIDSSIDISQMDAFSARGGGLLSTEGGVYRVNAIMLDHASRCINGFPHPATLGCLLANEFALKYNKPAFVVNPPDTDELCDLARVTGIDGVYRTVHMHALNLKETAIRHAETVGEKYEDCNYIVCHLGGGISVSAHKRGRMIDGNDIAGGEGPMTPTRCGSIPLLDFLKYSVGKDYDELVGLLSSKGGFVSNLGTSDAKKVINQVKLGDKKATRVWNAMLYQISKCIGAMSAVLCGDVDAILLGGGLVNSTLLVDYIKEACSFIAPVFAYPGEFELNALAAGAIRVLSGKEKAKEYTGIPIWSGFND